jgi:hypothetical protein
VYSVPASGGREATPLTQRNIEQLDENHWAPSCLPNGRHYLVLVRGGPDLRMQRCLAEVGPDQRRVIASDVTNGQYAPTAGTGPSYVLFVRGDRLIAQAFDAKTLGLSGKELTVAENVAVGGGGALEDFRSRRAACSRTEALRVSITNSSSTIARESRSDPSAIVQETLATTFASLRTDGQWRSRAWGSRGPTSGLPTLPGGGASRFTLNGGRTPAWSPDGQFVAYLREDAVYRKPVQGGGAEILIWRGPGLLAVSDWSGDSRFLLLTRWMTKEGLNGHGAWLLADPLSNSPMHDVTSIASSGIHPEFVPAIGVPRFISYDSADGQVYVRTMPGVAAGV